MSYSIFAAIVLCWGVCSSVASGANPVLPAQTGALRSSSGQFVVTSLADPRMQRTASTNSAVVELYSSTLTVTCERIKQALLRELNAPDSWRGKVYLVINPAMTNDQPAVIAAQPFVEGWQYRAELPLQISRIKLVRSVVQVLLLEMANRTAGMRSAEIPLWLLEGLTLHLVHSSLLDLVVDDPRFTVNRVRVASIARQSVPPDPLVEVRQRLGTHAAFSFTRLGEVGADQLATETWKTYQASAHLLVSRLLLLPGGRSGIASFLQSLPHSANWQAAFLTAFGGVFPRMLDAEKWWSVVLVHFTGMDPLHAWPMEVACQKLDEVLLPPVLVNTQPPGLSQRSKVPLQQVIGEWNYLQHRIILQSVLNQLVTMRIKLPPEVIPLADDYRSALDKYLSRRAKQGSSATPSGAASAAAERLVRDIIRQLDGLDQRRRELRPGQVRTAPPSPSVRTP